jgi:hypothetical protein
LTKANFFIIFIRENRFCKRFLLSIFGHGTAFATATAHNHWQNYADDCGLFYLIPKPGSALSRTRNKTKMEKNNVQIKFNTSANQ